MTVDQLNNELKDYYESLRAPTLSYLRAIYQINERPDSDSRILQILKANKGAIIWEISAPGNKRQYELLICLPTLFPDVLPRIYLKLHNLELEKSLHVGADGSICTRESGLVMVDDQQPGKAVSELIKIAVNILDGKESGIRDFQDEYLAYWERDAKYSLSLISTPKSFPVIWNYCDFQSNDKKVKFTSCSPQKLEIKKWLNNAKVDAHLVHSEKILCIELGDVPENIPRRNIEIRKILNNLNAETLDMLRRFPGTAVLAKVKINSKSFYISWHHSGDLHGFRKVDAPIPIMMGKSPQEPIERFKVKRFDPERILFRSMGNNTFLSKKSILLIGLGAIGSEMLMLLAKQGISRFTLVDPDKMEEVNVARHLCGVDKVLLNIGKVEAVTKELIAHLPYVQCNYFEENILSVMLENIGILSCCSISVCAIADYGTERRLNQFSYQSGTSPIIYLWMEQNGIGGHLVYVSPKNQGCIECCFENGNYKYSILKPGSVAPIRETGCQNSFTPFGAADISIFCGIISKQIINSLNSEQSENYIMTWVGDLESARKDGLEIHEHFKCRLSYTLSKQKINPNSECSICKHLIQSTAGISATDE